MHLRRVQLSEPADPEISHAVICELSWADVSRIGTSVLELSLQFFTILFSLRYVSNTAASDFKMWGWRPLRGLMLVASAVLCGPIAALYCIILVLLAGRTLALTCSGFANRLPAALQPLVHSLGMEIAGVVLLLISAAIWWFWSERPQKPWWCHPPLVAAIGVLGLLSGFGADVLTAIRLWPMWAAMLIGAVWLLIVSWRNKYTWGGIWRLPLLCLIVIAVAVLFACSVCPEFATRVLQRAQPEAISNPASVVLDNAQLLVCAAGFLSLLVCVSTVLAAGLWVIAQGIAIRLWLRDRTGDQAGNGTADRQRACEHSAAANAAVGSLLVQLGLWSLALPLLIHIVMKGYQGAVGTQVRLFENVPLLLTVDIVLAFFVSVVVVIVLFVRCLWTKCRIAKSLAPRIPRLLVHWTVVCAIFAASIIGGFDWLKDEPGIAWLKQWSGISVNIPSLGDLLLQHFYLNPTAVAAGALIVVGFVLKASREVRAVLHVVTDIASHFYEPAFFWLKGQDLPWKFAIQQRLEYRLLRVIEELLWVTNYNLRRITVVAHSQGSQIAIDVLWYKEVNDRLLEMNREYGVEPRVDLVTFGAPFSHLYQHYFPARYPPLYKRKNGKIVLNVAKDCWPDSKLPETVGRWTNAYHLDDFIGKEIVGKEVVGNNKGSFPWNHELEQRRGHTGYWDDLEFLRAIDDLLPGRVATD